MSKQHFSHTIVLAGTAMLCFAANSILCRLALAPKLIDAATFTTLRVLSAATMLTLIVSLQYRRLPRLSCANWLSVMALFGYLVFFSFAYLRLEAGTGALILIGAVQLSMFSIAFWEGERFTSAQWIGLSLALLAFIYLLLPGASAPAPAAAVLMMISGVALGMVFLAGPRRQTSVGGECQQPTLLPAPRGPRELFHRARPRSHHCRCASCNRLGRDRHGSRLCRVVPRIARPAGRRRSHGAAFDACPRRPGGTAFLSEPLSLRLVVASAALLGGIALVLKRRDDGVRR